MTLLQKIQRLPISDAQKERLIGEAKNINEAKLNEFSKLLDQHDLDAVALLNEKSKLKAVFKDQLQAMDPIGKAPHVSQEKAKEFIKALEHIFTTPDFLAKFLAIADDVVLVQIENLLVGLLQGDPQHQQNFKNFFKEIRLQKAAFDREEKAEMNAQEQKEIAQREKHTKELDELIAEGKRLLKSEKKKA